MNPEEATPIHFQCKVIDLDIGMNNNEQRFEGSPASDCSENLA